MPWWEIGAAANALVAVAYLAISGAIAVSIRRGAQWRSNPLAVATAAIFLTCALHHGAHAVHLLWESGPGDHGMRGVYDDPWLSGLDVVTAVVGVWYWSLRGRLPALVRGAALFDDLEMRRRQALELHDGVVQGLATAKLALELEQFDLAAAELERTLETSKSIITGLLVDGRDLGEPGSVRRGRSAPS